MRVSAVSFAVVVHLSHATRWCDSGALRTPRYRAHGRERRQHQAQPVHTVCIPAAIGRNPERPIAFENASTVTPSTGRTRRACR